MNAIIKRLKSKTYWVAVTGALLTLVEVNSGYLSGLLPPEYVKYSLMFWPVLMLTLREVTSGALEDK
jgi:hypothetical protein